MSLQHDSATGENRLETYDGGEVLYFAVDPDGVWARSAFPSDLMTFDFDADDNLIGIEVIGSLASGTRAAIENALSGELGSDPGRIADLLKAALSN